MSYSKSHREYTEASPPVLRFAVSLPLYTTMGLASGAMDRSRYLPSEDRTVPLFRA